MTVALTFTPDDRELRAVGPNTEAVLLYETSLVVQVGFRVGDRELLDAHRPRAKSEPIGGPEGPASWMMAPPFDVVGAPQPLIGFLCKTRDAIHRAANGHASIASLAFGWPSLSFDPGGDGLIAVRLGRAAPATAESGEFAAAMANFQDSVRAGIAASAPALQQHRDWSNWFGDERS